MRNGIIFDTQVGTFTVIEEDGFVCEVRIGEPGSISPEKPDDMICEETKVLKRAKQQLCEYAEGRRKSFDFPFVAVGTEFQKKVWDALSSIPYGETRSYKQIAKQVGNPNGCRAVGMANHKNPIGVVIPCHRVVGSGGALTGYAGGLDRKKSLLELEQRHR